MLFISAGYKRIRENKAEPNCDHLLKSPADSSSDPGIWNNINTSHPNKLKRARMNKKGIAG
ncbi:hypothetical protein D3C81_1912440 [compost metagenome]